MCDEVEWIVQQVNVLMFVFGSLSLSQYIYIYIYTFQFEMCFDAEENP